ncbi:hypothetical protein V9T40_012729 [Parthenolecanium corni]|uniref:Choline/ethanolamine transporter FLVCR1 n=1 Tax=Parthenolecanium corni TaxID=536013 RepID=A0AAN9TBM5_9HEMI
MSLIKNYADLEKSEDIAPTDVIENQKSECRLYPRRWLILILFVFYSMSNAMQWIQYSIISDVITKYYNVPSFYVDWTSMIYMVTYIPLIFPGSWLLNKLGIRISVLLGAVGTCIGAWVKVFSVAPDKFYVTFIGQTIVAISQTFVLSLPARVAAVWFGQNEVSSACSIGVFGNQFGIAVGFVVPPILIKWGNTEEDGLRLIYYGVAVITTVILLLICLFFEDKPDLPPSPAQAAQKCSDTQNDFGGSIRRLLMNKGYVLLLLSYGINVGVFYAISTLLNTVILHYFPTGQEDAGIIGLVIVIVGMVGSVCCGYILDKTRLFKEITLIVYASSVIGMLAFTFTLGRGQIYIVYITASLLGFFMTGYLPVGFELASELTYPEPEGTSSGLINAGAQVFGIAFTIMYGLLIPTVGEFWSNICLIFMLIAGTLLTAFIPSDLRRQLACQAC